MYAAAARRSGVICASELHPSCWNLKYSEYYWILMSGSMHCRFINERHLLKNSRKRPQIVGEIATIVTHWPRYTAGRARSSNLAEKQRPAYWVLTWLNSVTLIITALCNNLEYLRLTRQCGELDEVENEYTWHNFSLFAMHLSDKNYRNSWKFDEVLTKQLFCTVFETRCVYASCITNSPLIELTWSVVHWSKVTTEQSLRFYLLPLLYPPTYSLGSLLHIHLWPLKV